MKKILTMVTVLMLMTALIYGELMQETNLLTAKEDNTNRVVQEGSRREPPMFSFGVLPLSLGATFYDYFPGGYESIPIRVQPSPAGFNPGGGIYIAYQSTPAAGGVRRVNYAYIEDGVVSNSGLINLAGQSAEGFPGIDIDLETGNPFVSWHAINPSNTNYYYCPLTYDEYNMIGVPGLWNSPYGVIDNPYTIGTETENEFIWPAVFIGPAPTEGMRRVFVVGKNYAQSPFDLPGENSMIAFADFMDPTDLAMYDENDWTFVTVPQLDDWRAMNVRPFRATIVSRITGHIAIVGHTAELTDGADPYGPNNVMFVIENSNYGEGDWTMYTGDPTIPVANPLRPSNGQGYFVGEGDTPYQDLRYSPSVNRHNAVVDDRGNYHFIANYTLSTEENTYYPNFTTVKHVKFIKDTQEFVYTDIYPRHEDGSLYLPWGNEPEWNTEDGQEYPTTSVSWPYHWWDTEDSFHENYFRIIQQGPMMVALFQESIKARLFNEYGDEDYANWSNVPETYIMISGDYGTSWSDPIILNANETPELADMIPAYWYIADHIDDIGNDWGRIHLFFLDDNEYGSFIQGNGQNTGGTLSYTALDIDFSTVGGFTSVEESVAINTSSMLRQNYPNPFNPSTTIAFSLPTDTNVKLEVYNIKGQLVKTLVNSHKQAGENSVVWNGTDNNGSTVGSGLYFYKLAAGEYTETKRMLLVK